MNAYRTQLQFRAKIAEFERQQREICKQYGLHIDLNEPELAEQSETGDKMTLAPRRKCGIIKAIGRHVRRWKRKQEGKTMKAYYAYHARGFENEYIIIFADDERAKEAAKNYENERAQRGGNPLFYRVTRKQAEKMCDIETAENIRDRLPGLFK